MRQNRKSQEEFFKASDGKEIFYRFWPANIEADKSNKCFVLLHRGHEHSARLQYIVDELEMPDVPMFSFDARGHGHTEGPRGYSPSVARTVKDIDDFVSFITQKYNIKKENILIIAQSISAVYAAAWVHDYAPKIRGLVLASPALSIKLYVPFACEGMTLWQKIRGRHFYISSYVNANFLTHDPERRKSYNEDPLITKAIASNILLELEALGKRIVKDARAIRVPTQVFISGSDVVVHHGPQHEFYKNLGSEIKEKHVMEGFFHDTIGEQNRSIVFAEMRRFIGQIYSQNVYQHDYTHEDVWGATADEYRALKSKPPFYCPKGLWFKICKLSFNTLGQLSDGLRLGKKIGYNAGVMLDYIYQNKPSGKLLIGKLFDKFYLQSPGWAGIRKRKINLEEMISKAIAQLKQDKKPVRILDVAAGKGRYLLDAIAKENDNVESVVLRDFSEQNVKEGTALIKERNLQNKVKFEQADAFNVEQTAAVQPRPTLVVVSGFYEIFPQNEPIEKSLQGISAAIEKDGLLVYTAQPYHPQLELIARTLRDLHSPDEMWVMRARTQAEMDFLVEKAGFVKESEVIDEEGIFSVSIARKK